MASVRGKKVAVLRGVAYLGVKELLMVFPKRLSWEELAAKTGRKSVRTALETIRIQHPEFRSAIDFPEQGGWRRLGVGINPW